MTRIVHKRWLALLGLTLAGACAPNSARPCSSSLLELIPSSDVFAEGAGMTTPDRGVSVESGASPNAVCSVGYNLAGGTIATLNLYAFDDAAAAEAGYRSLADEARTLQTTFETPQEPFDLSSAAPRADSLYTECHAREGDTRCRVVARYGSHTYLLSISHLAASNFTQYDLDRVVETLDNKMASIP